MLVRAVFAAIALSVAVTTSAQESRLDDVAKRGALRVCTPGDYKPFSLAKTDGTFEGLDVDLVQAMAKSLGVEAKFVKTSWPKLMDDFIAQCDIAVGGISVTLDRQKRAFFSSAYMVNGKAPITKCENVAKFQTVADIDKPNVTVIENPGGSNERFARANFKQAKIVIFEDNTKIFDEILKGNADVMIGVGRDDRAVEAQARLVRGQPRQAAAVRRDGLPHSAGRRDVQGVGGPMVSSGQGDGRVRSDGGGLAQVAVAETAAAGRVRVSAMLILVAAFERRTLTFNAATH